ncbi:MAG: immunity 53 family protein [Candidatus Acidiferrum sp.]
MSLSILENWYSRQCDGDWEHSFGVKISTIDNPGWSVSVDLHDTHKQKVVFEQVKIDRQPDDWIHYWAKKEKFEIRCGSLNLSEAIEIFGRWFDSP